MSSDKRKFTRYIVNGEVFLKNENGTKYNCHFESINVSFGGLAVYSFEKLDVAGNIFEFNLITTIHNVQLQGKAKNLYFSEEKRAGKPIYRMGFEFVDMNKDMVSFLLSSIQKANSMESRRAALRVTNKGGVF